jgi:hypothetical protein
MTHPRWAGKVRPQRSIVDAEHPLQIQTINALPPPVQHDRHGVSISFASARSSALFTILAPPYTCIFGNGKRVASGVAEYYIVRRCYRVKRRLGCESHPCEIWFELALHRL